MPPRSSPPFDFTNYVQGAAWVEGVPFVVTILQTTGDEVAVLKFRSISKSWRDYIDHCVPDSVFRDRLLIDCLGKSAVRYLPKQPPSSSGTWRAVYRHVLGPTPTFKSLFPPRECDERRDLAPEDVTQLLSWLMSLAESAAVDFGLPFHRLFGNFARGYAHAVCYLAQKGTSSGAGSSEAARVMSQSLIMEWWDESLSRLRDRVADRLSDAADADRKAAEVSLEDFVRKMSKIPFHGAKLSTPTLERGMRIIRARRAGAAPADAPADGALPVQPAAPPPPADAPPQP